MRCAEKFLLFDTLFCLFCVSRIGTCPKPKAFRIHSYAYVSEIPIRWLDICLTCFWVHRMISNDASSQLFKFFLTNFNANFLFRLPKYFENLNLKSQWQFRTYVLHVLEFKLWAHCFNFYHICFTCFKPTGWDTIQRPDFINILIIQIFLTSFETFLFFTCKL